jgi:hypothetical protein
MYLAKRTAIKVTLDRESVCMGNDVPGSYAKEIEISIKSSLSDLLVSADLKTYLPDVAEAAVCGSRR